MGLNKYLFKVLDLHGCDLDRALFLEVPEDNILLSVCYHFVFAWLFMSKSYTRTGLQICSGTSTRQLQQMESYGKKENYFLFLISFT